jgi:hypothetical protein
MDTWTKEQVEVRAHLEDHGPFNPADARHCGQVMKNMGNAKSNAIYNPNEARHPPPPNLEDGERDSEMEQYIRGAR